MKKIIGLLLLIIVMGSCANEERMPTIIDADIEDYEFITESILADTTLASFGVVSVHGHDYVYSHDENLIIATYNMVETNNTFPYIMFTILGLCVGFVIGIIISIL